jgi:hypothetical protein
VIDELTVLRLLAVKGRLTPEVLATSVAADLDTARGQLDDYAERGWVTPVPAGFRMTPAGRERCAELQTAERTTTNPVAVEAVYREFLALNTDLKAVITDWQMRGPDQVNDHTDADYDSAVLDRLQALHVAAGPMAERIADTAPRLWHYRNRLDTAAGKVAAGDTAYVARPLIDSYHTVWFELHDELIGLAGKTRAGEAEAGHAG